MHAEQWLKDRGRTTHLPSRAALCREVEHARERIRAVDPAAYGGFVTDKAVMAVANRTGVNWRLVLKAWRHYHPVDSTARARLRGIPWDARPVSRDGREAATAWPSR